MTAAPSRPTLEPMSTIELPDDVAAALAAAAAQRGVTEAELIAELVAELVAGEPDELDAFIGVGASGRADALDAFIGCADSGDPDWAATDTKVLRKQAAARLTADRV